MGQALIDTPDWQVTMTLGDAAFRVMNYCTAIEELLQAQEMVSDPRDRAKVGAFIREELRTYYGTLIEAEIADVRVQRLRAKSSGLMRAGDSLVVTLTTAKDSLWAIVRP